jgi:glycosyltransferase involved in cell wall biosynthesis
VEEFKGVSVLLEAARDLERRAISVTVLLAGDGPGRGHYEAMAQRLADVRFLGVLDRERLAEYYAAADLLVLPSRSEPWGFVLNEGMEFGLPLVVSTAVGAAADLVADGVNGIVVQAGDAAGLAASIAALVADGDALGRFGRQSRRRVESYDPAAWAAGVRRAVAEVCARAALEPEISPQGSD